MAAKENDKLKITELFFAQAGRERRFYGTIQRDSDDNGIPYVYGEIRINQGYIYSRADNQDRYVNLFL